MATNIGWSLESSNGGPGTAGEYNYNFYSGVSSNSVLSPFQMGIFWPSSGAVPEPSSVVLLGLGLASIAVAGRFRNRRTA